MKKQRTLLESTKWGTANNKLTTDFVKGVSILALVMCLFLVGVASAADPDLVSWWRFDEGSGSTAYDSAGSNNGTITGATWTTGKYEDGLDFDGSGDYVNITNGETIGTGAKTICAWIYPESLAGLYYGRILENGKCLFLINGDYHRLQFSSNANNAYLTPTNSLTIDTWHHVCAVRDSSGVANVYINGTISGTPNQASGTPVAGTTNLYIGNRQAGDRSFNGIIDDVRIYDRALSETEIQAVMQGKEFQLPGFRAPLLTEPTSPEDFNNVGGSSSSGPSTSDPEIKSLARGLKYDPGLMYKFVHDHIKFEPTWGELKGPYMTWMDRSGNGFDQASLMIALLEEAADNDPNIEDPNYVVGEIQLTDDQAMNWLDLGGDDPNIAKQVLARGGLYGSVSETGGVLSSLNMIHVWVTVTIDGNEYEFDPSFKSYTKTNGLSPTQLENAMGYDVQEKINFLADANEGSSSGSDWDKDINKANITEDLTTYTTNLIEELKSNYHGSDLEDIIGGLRIDPADANAMPPDSLPYTVISRDDESSIDNMPQRYRTTLQIQHSGIDKTFFSSDIYGRRLTLKYNGSNQPQIILDGIVKDTGNATTLGNLYDLTLSVDHPYYVDDFDATTTIKVVAGGFYQIVNGWGNTGTKIIQKHRGELQQYIYDGDANDSETVLGESYAIVGLTWLAQTSRMRSMAASKLCNSSKIVNHHMLGITGEYDSPYIDIPLGHLGVYNYDDANAVFLAVTGHASAYEHQIIRQLHDCNAVSTVNLLEMANDRSTYDKIYAADENNWSSVQSQLNSYSQDANDLAYDYVKAGFDLHMPQYGSFGNEEWSGTGFQAILSTSNSITASYIISGGYSGGCSEPNDLLSPSQILDNSDVVGLDSGAAYTCSPTDLSIGSLSFSRQYSSARRLEDGPLGLGWTHNFDITAKVQSDSFQILGSSPVDAAAHIVSLYVTYDVLENDNDSLRYNMISSLCQSWLMDQMQDNIVTIDQGGGKMRIVKDPNGTYNAGSMRLVTQGNGNFRLKNSKGIFYDYDSDGRMSEMSDAHGNTVEYTYTGGKLTKVARKIGGTEARWISFTYDANDHITDVNDSAGRSISYTYDSNDNLIEYTNLDGYDYKYEYDDANDGQLTKVYLPTDHSNPYVTNVYDCLGHLIQRIDANDKTWDFYYAYYRTETLEPNQVDPNNNTKRFSVVRWANPDNRTITTTDRLGRQTTSYFDGQLRIDKIFTPSDTSAEFEYDKNSKMTQRTVIPGPGSSDPNIVTSSDYEEHGDPKDPNDRWFIHTKQTTGASGNITYYQYDYNDVGTYGTEVGNLMKITYPDVNTPNGTETPIVKFKYNSYGQLIRKTDPNGMETEYEYYLPAAGAGLKKTIVDCNGTSPLNITTELTYDSVGRVISAKDPLGNIGQSEYYDSGLLKKTITPAADSNEITYEYYEDGRLMHVKQQTTDEGLVYLQSITYNDRRQKETVKGPYNSGSDPNINLTTFYYDGLGRLWKVKDAEDNITETRYYPDGKVWRVIDAEDHNNVTYTYDPNNGSLLKVEDANDNATEYEYDYFMRPKKTIYADGTSEEVTYDIYGRLIQRKTRAGDTISVEYDVLNRVDKKTTPDQTIEYVYDITSRLVETSEVWLSTSDKETISNTYDDVGRLIQIDYPGGRSVAYEYDLAGNRTKLTYPDNDYITYEYDNLNRLTKIRNDANTVLSEYSYDERSRREELTYANGTGIEYAYDVASRLLSINNLTDSGQNKYEYTYDKVGNRLTMLVNDIDEHKYTYDDIYQVTDVNYPDGYESLAYDTTFNYDDVGSRTSVIDDGTTNYAVNKLNQYTSVGSISFDYDQNGNLTFDGIGYYSYDTENRLTEALNASDYNGGPLNIALDNTDIVFTTGGDANWVYTTAEYYDANDGDSAHSTELPADANNWLKATVYGKGTVKFYAKVSGGSLAFKIDGQLKQTITSGWTYQIQYDTDLGKHTLEWKYYGAGNAWVDQVEWNSTGTPSSTLSDGLDTDWDAYTGGDASWFKRNWGYYDNDCVESGDIDHDEVSQLEVLTEGEGNISFYWKVSSEEDYDYLKFYIDGEEQDKISGEVDWELKSYSLSDTGTHSLLWEYAKDSSTDVNDDCGWVDYLQLPGSPPSDPNSTPGELSEAVDSDLIFTTSGDENWYRDTGSSSEFYYEGDSARNSADLDDDEVAILETTVEGAGTIKFYWKVSSEQNDYLEFYIDGNDPSEGGNKISGEVDWQLKSFAVTGSGTHTLKWQYIKNSSVSDGNDCGWVDYVRWTGLSQGPDPDQWETAEYEYDPSGRRIKKKVNGYATRYLYDGGHVIAEYDGNHNLLRKFVYGPGVDQPVCMIDVIDSNEPYYYHFDGLGSVMALTDANGVIVEQYAYDAFGQPAIQAGTCTVGDTEVFASTTTWANRMAMPYTMPEDGVIQSISIYHEGGSGDMLLAVYDNSSGKPGNRLGLTEETPIHSYQGWQTVKLITPVDVNEGDSIWLAWVFESNPGIRYKWGIPGRADSGQTWADGMPSEFGSSTTNNYIYSIYANYTPDEQDQQPELLGNPYMFTGRRFDLETGLYYYRARYYNPYIGRFLQTDPIGYGYGYCANNPMNYVDPSGNYKVRFWWHEDQKSPLQVDWFSDNGEFLRSNCYHDWNEFLDSLYSGLLSSMEKYSSSDNDWKFNEEVPEYEIMLDIACALDIGFSEINDYYKIRTDVILRNVEESKSRYINGVMDLGEFDFRFIEDGEGIYILPDGTVLIGAEFGNYCAGYGGYYHFGDFGILGTHLAGDFYALEENMDLAWGSWVEGFYDWYTPPTGTWFDDWESNRDINKGIYDAMIRKHTYFPEVQIPESWLPFRVSDFTIIGTSDEGWDA